MHVNGFTYGPLTPLLAFLMSFLGSAIGLQSASRARGSVGGPRYRWLAMASLSIGGTAIWVMHYVAVLGFTVPGADIRYDPLLTVASLVVAVGVVAVGLTVVVTRDGSAGSLALGGVVTGTGVAAMHYLGMGALRMAPSTHFDVTMVAVSEVVAVGAATAALWFALHVRGLPATLGAAAIMGLALTGMHYVGMEALRVTATAATDPSGWIPGMPVTSVAVTGGMTAAQLLTPLVVGICVTTTVMLLVVAMAPTERELREEQRAAQMSLALRSRQ